MANPLGRPPFMLRQNLSVHVLSLPLGPQAMRNGAVPLKGRR